MAGTARWKRFAIISIAVASLCSAAAALIFHSLVQIPAFYKSVDGLSADDCTTESRQFVRQSTAIFNQIENEPGWNGVFRERQVNAWLAWDFARKHSEILPTGVSSPRVSFDDGCINLGFHWQDGPVATVISARGRVWLPEPNFVAVELQGVHAGTLPIPSGIVVHTVSAAARSADIDVEWRQRAGHPVALIRLSPPGKKHSIRVDRIELREGLLYLAGRSSDGSPTKRAKESADSHSEVSLNQKSPEASRHR